VEPEQIAVERYKAEQMYISAASWFSWIGGLSILNSVMTSSGKQFNFTFGLGISQIGDAWQASGSGILSTLGFFLSFGFSGLFILLAWLARHTTVALPIGTVVYGLDALLFLIAQDWIGLGFHVFALFLIITGWRASNKMKLALPPPVSAEAPKIIPESGQAG